jgi:sRNA-binding carbon storage regulator CsrA
MLVIGRKFGERIEVFVPPSSVTRKIVVQVNRQDHGDDVAVCFDAEKDIRIERVEIPRRERFKI